MSVQCDNINSKTNDESQFMFFVKAKVDNESSENEVLIPSLNSANQPTSLQSSTKYELVFNHISNKLIYNSDPYNLYYEAKEKLQDITLQDLHNLMDFVSNNHTYLNRIDAMIKAVKMII
jgi:hypothetical protein